MGAKDLNLPEFVFHYSNAQQLYEKMLYLSEPKNYSEVQERISKMELPIDMSDHTKAILKLYAETENEHNSINK